MTQPALSAALPELQPGVSVELLRRVWNAAPAERRYQRATLLDSIVTVSADGQLQAKPLRDLTLADVEDAIGAVTPRFVVRYWQPGKLGVQAKTFVERSAADKFAAGKRLYSQRAVVQELSL